jgi:hypothetical protein
VVRVVLAEVEEVELALIQQQHHLDLIHEAMPEGIAVVLDAQVVY